MNNSDKDYVVSIGDRIAQAVFRKTDDFELGVVDCLMKQKARGLVDLVAAASDRANGG